MYSPRYYGSSLNSIRLNLSQACFFCLTLKRFLYRFYNPNRKIAFRAIQVFGKNKLMTYGCPLSIMFLNLNLIANLLLNLLANPGFTRENLQLLNEV